MRAPGLLATVARKALGSGASAPSSRLPELSRPVTRLRLRPRMPRATRQPLEGPHGNLPAGSRVGGRRHRRVFPGRFPAIPAAPDSGWRSGRWLRPRVPWVLSRMLVPHAERRVGAATEAVTITGKLCCNLLRAPWPRVNFTSLRAVGVLHP